MLPEAKDENQPDCSATNQGLFASISHVVIGALPVLCGIYTCSDPVFRHRGGLLAAIFPFCPFILTLVVQPSPWD